MSEIRTKIIDGLLWGIGGRVILLFFNFLTIVVTARLLSPAEFGLYATAQIFIDLGYAVANSSLGTPIVRTSVLDKEMERFGFAAFLLSSIVLSVALGFGSSYIAAFFAMPELSLVIVFLSLVMPFRIMSGYYVSVMLQKMYMRSYQVSQTLPQVLGLMVTIAMAYYGLGYWSLVGGFAVSSLAELAIAMVWAEAQSAFPRTAKPLREYWRIGSGTLVARGASAIVASTDKAVIANLIDAAAVGLYSRALSIMMIPFKVITLVATRIFLAGFSKIQNDEDRGKALGKILALQAYIYIPMSAGLWLTSDFLVRLALGERWLACIPICQILSCALFARLGYEVVNNALTAVGRVWAMAFRVAASIPFVFVFCVVGYYIWGLNGVALGVSITLIITYIVSLLMACQEFGCASAPVVRAHVLGSLLAVVAAFIAVWIAGFPFNNVVPEIARPLTAPLYFSLIVVSAWMALPKYFLGDSFRALKNW